MEETILCIENLSKSFGATRALKGVSFSMAPGEILGLAGENGSGKSTLVKILCGIHARDTGRTYLQGQPFEPADPQESERAGLSVFHQEIPICENMSVAANLFLSSKMPSRHGSPDWKWMNAETVRLFRDLLNESIDPTARMADCTIAERQMTLLVRALSRDARLIVLDEPTTALTPGEVKKMFTIIRNLQKKGISFIFISHMMEEMLDLCDHVVVLRDGDLVGERYRGEYTRDDLAALIAGRTLAGQISDRNIHREQPLLELTDYTARAGYEPLNLTVYKGEILGVAGLAGSGRVELVESLFGIGGTPGGSIKLAGKPLQITSPQDAMAAGLGYLPEDRKTQGLFYGQDLKYNVGIAGLTRWISHGLQKTGQLMDLVAEYTRQINIKADSPHASIDSLSGGNQQKVLLARWILLEPRLFLMNEPTRGIDVGAKQEICDVILRMSNAGYTFIIASSELEELIALSDRLIVLNRGKLITTLSRGSITKEAIIKASA